MKLDLSIYTLLKKHNLIDGTIKNMLWHMNISDITIRKMKNICGINEELEESELANRIALLIRSCNQNSENYNEELYIKLCRVGYDVDMPYKQYKAKYGKEEIDNLVNDMLKVAFAPYQSSSRRR